MSKLTLFTTLLLISSVTYCFSKKIPLEFHPRHGTYSMKLIIGLSEPIKLIVDTGSSNLNVIGNEVLCPLCKPHIQSKRFEPDHQTRSLNENFKINYGVGRGLLQLYKGKIVIQPGFELNDFRFGVYREGAHVVNILGMAYPRLAVPRNKKMTTLFLALQKKYNFSKQFSLLLCQNSSKSMMVFGKDSLNKLEDLPQYKIPLAWRGFFSAFHYGISTQNKQRIMTLEPGTTAIFDSGTTGKLIYPEKALASVRQYLFDNTSNNNRTLPKGFWQGKRCVYKSMIDEEAFPTLYLHFINTKGELLRLPLEAKYYLTSVGCHKGRVRLAFISNEYIFRNKKNQKVKKRLMKKIILGTPLLESYHTVFKMDEPRGYIFTNSNTLCNQYKSD